MRLRGNVFDQDKNAECLEINVMYLHYLFLYNDLILIKII